MAAPVISQVVMDANTVTTITNNLNSLYSNAIGQLTSYTLGVIALVGVLIPALVTLIQWRSLKAEKENLQTHVENEISKAKINIRENIEAEMKLLIASEESKLLIRIEEKFRELENQLACADASTFHIQGNSQLDKSFYSTAAEDFSYASRRYLEGGDEQNAQRTLRLLIQKCLPNINKTDFEMSDDLDEKIDALIIVLKEKNENGRYAEHISDLNKERRDAKKREVTS